MTSVFASILGVVPKDDKYNQMLQVFDACKSAGISYPAEIEEFFDLDEHCKGYEPPKDGIEIDLREVEDVVNKEYDDYDESVVYDIDISKLPKNVQKIRVKCFFG